MVPPGMTYLESRSVRPATLKDYQLRMSRFRNWCSLYHLPLDSPAQVDLALVEYLQDLFSKGRGKDDGIRTHAALRFFMPHLGKPSSGSLPRTVRALKGWSLAAPGQQRLPLPIEVLGAIMGVLCNRNLHQLALRLFLQFVTYMRPGECSNLLVKQLVPPQSTMGGRFDQFAILLHPLEDQTPGKTGVFDASVVVDSDHWLNPILLQLVASRSPDEQLWEHPHGTLVDEFAAAQEFLKLGHLNSCLYTLRHGGATHDIMTRRRSMLEVKQRGRWGSDQSLKRYVKLARLQTELSKVPLETREYGLRILRELPTILSLKLIPANLGGTTALPSACSASSAKRKLSRENPEVT